MVGKDLTQCLIVQGHFGDYLRHALFQADLNSPGDALVIVAAHHGDLYRALLQEAVAEGHHAAGGLVPENLALLRQLADHRLIDAHKGTVEDHKALVLLLQSHEQLHSFVLAHGSKIPGIGGHCHASQIQLIFPVASGSIQAEYPCQRIAGDILQAGIHSHRLHALLP